MEYWKPCCLPCVKKWAIYAIILLPYLLILIFPQRLITNPKQRQGIFEFLGATPEQAEHLERQFQAQDELKALAHKERFYGTCTPIDPNSPFYLRYKPLDAQFDSHDIRSSTNDSDSWWNSFIERA